MVPKAVAPFYQIHFILMALNLRESVLVQVVVVVSIFVTLVRNHHFTLCDFYEDMSNTKVCFLLFLLLVGGESATLPLVCLCGRPGCACQSAP